MDNIDAGALDAAKAFVGRCSQEAEIHTVVMVTDGASGGIVITIEGATEAGDETRRQFFMGGIRSGEEILTNQARALVGYGS